MRLDHTVRSSRTYDETVSAVVSQTEAAGFRVLAVHDVQATLAEKGFERAPLTIVEVCNARHAHAVLAADPKIGLMLPCPIMVYASGDEVLIATMRPTLIADFFPDTDLGSTPADVESALLSIMDASAS